MSRVHSPGSRRTATNPRFLLIALWRDWVGSPIRCSPRIATSLGLFAGQSAAYHAAHRTCASHLVAPRPGKISQTWRPFTTRRGETLLLSGRIDNAYELASGFGLTGASPEALYARAVEEWGLDADYHVSGNYCSILASETALRIARSPWDAPPLCFASFDGQTVVSSVPRAILAAGLPNRLDRIKLADNLFFNLLDRTRGWYEGMHRVAIGTVVTIAADGEPQVHSYYDPRALPKISLRNDDEYVETARMLLTDGTRRALEGSKRPGMMLSGGLDSPLVACAALDCLPQEQRLPSFTFAPIDSWKASLPEGLMGDERPFVSAFAEMHPRIDAHFTQNKGIGFDHRFADFFAAMGSAPSHLCNFYVYHGVWRGAREAGCDVLLSAEFGNQTFSAAGEWCFTEYLRTFRLRQLWLAAKHRSGDARPMWQRIAALSVFRLLPRAIRRAVRAQRHPDRASLNALLCLLPENAAASAERRAAGLDAIIDFENPASHEDAVAFDYAWHDCESAEVRQAFEQIYGLRAIDVPTYRPLAEFCAGIPTKQFVRDGTTRWLARRMAKGRLPEAQRINTRYGRHGVDWHERLTPRLSEFRMAAQSIGQDPDLADLIDTDKLDALLQTWPQITSPEIETVGRYGAAVPRALLTAQFVRYVSGRNAF